VLADGKSLIKNKRGGGMTNDNGTPGMEADDM
jgi:hypothetical protein